MLGGQVAHLPKCSPLRSSWAYRPHPKHWQALAALAGFRRTVNVGNNICKLSHLLVYPTERAEVILGPKQSLKRRPNWVQF